MQGWLRLFQVQLRAAPAFSLQAYCTQQKIKAYQKMQAQIQVKKCSTIVILSFNRCFSSMFLISVIFQCDNTTTCSCSRVLA